MINQAMHLGIMGLIREMFITGRASDVDLDQLLEAISHSSGNSRMLERFGTDIANEQYEPQFALSLAYKDIRLVQKMQKMLNVDCAIHNMVTNVYSDFIKNNTELKSKNFSIICNKNQNP